MIIANVLLPALVIATLAAEPDPKLEAAHAQAQACADATVTGDYEKLADHTHPKVIAMMGGRQKMIERTRDAMEQVKRDGVSIVSVKVKAPESVHQAGTELYCVVPAVYRMKNADRHLLMKSPLIGVSSDKGKSWKFIDTSLGEEKVRKLVPEIPKSLKFPPKEDPQFESNPANQ